MRRAMMISALCGTFLAGGAGLVAAQAPAAPKPAAAAPQHEHEGKKVEGNKMMCPHMMGGGGMGMGMGATGGMGMGHMMGNPMMGGFMGAPGTKVAVKNVDKGVTITLTAPDAASAARLQKMAEAMRLMHEAMAPEK